MESTLISGAIYVYPTAGMIANQPLDSTDKTVLQ
jgi:hypothetical protein